MPCPREVHSPGNKKDTNTENYNQCDGPIKVGRPRVMGQTSSSEQGCWKDPLEGVGFLRAESEPELTVWNGRVGESY